MANLAEDLNLSALRNCSKGASEESGYIGVFVEGIHGYTWAYILGAFLVSLMGKNLPAMQETPGLTHDSARSPGERNA